MIKNTILCINLANNFINEEIKQVALVFIISLLFLIFYQRIAYFLYGKRKRLPLIYKLTFLLVYMVFLLILTLENFLPWLVIIYIIYLIIINFIKKPELYTKIINTDPFKFKKVNIDDKDFEQKAFDIYKRVMYSWSNLDMEPCKDILSKRLYNLYTSQTNSLYIKEQKNVISNIELVKSKVKNVTKSKNYETITVLIQVKCKDYLISSKDGSILKGHPSFLMNYIYELVFIREKNYFINNVCPHCNAILQKKNQKRCGYCNKTIIDYNYKYVLIKKELIKQSAKKINL